MRYGLLVNIAWLGDDFEKSLIHMIGVDRRTILFYHKKPMILSGVNNFTRVTFPDCENDLQKCEFEVNQLQKVSSLPRSFGRLMKCYVCFIFSHTLYGRKTIVFSHTMYAKKSDNLFYPFQD